jgi:hypothetical protein
MTRKCGDFSVFGLAAFSPQRWPSIGLTVRIQAAGIGHSWRDADAELGFKHGDPRLKHLVLLPRQPRHVLDRLKLLPFHNIEVPQNPLRLVADYRIDLALDAIAWESPVSCTGPLP